MAGTLVAAALVVGMLASVWQAVRATTAESIAQKERSKAERFAKTEAEARALAVDQTRLANERLDDLARRLYIHRVNLGYREAVANNVAQVTHCWKPASLPGEVGNGRSASDSATSRK